MQNICKKISRNQRNKLQVAHFLEYAKNMSKHSANTSPPTDDGLMLSGYQKKLKTMKKKFFVLYKDTQHNTARLEYYDNERKFKSGLPPKRVIRLRNCFSINRRLDTKHDFVIALSTKDGGFGIVLDNEDEMLRWLEILISLQRANVELVDQHIRPQYEHVWQVFVQRKGLAELKGIIGNYHVCLTTKSLTFVRIGPDKTSDGNNRLEHVEFQLTTIRRCGDSQCYFYMEVGRQSVIGPGELWMETEDALTAQNMHQMILSAMSTKVDGSNMGPMQRKRSSSANEASKPINVLQIKQTYVDNKFINSPNTSSIKFGRERCDSLPTRNRTSSDSSNHSFTLPSGLFIGGGSNARNISLTGGLRSHTYQRHSNSPPINSSNFGCSESEESSISIDEPDDSCGFMPYRFNSRSSEGVIPEENTDDIGGSDCSTKYNDLSSQIDIATMAENYVNMAPVIAKSQQTMNTDHNQINNVLSPEHHTPPRLDIEFAECAVDHVAKILSPDEETQMERPTRAYSIGSRNEHNRLFKQHMGGVLSSGTAGGGASNVYNSDTSEHPSGRVRAFSVGSKARIPRCDLQRGMLKPKLLLEYQQKELKDNNNKHHCHSNSSSSYNISTDLGLLSGSPSISSSITTTNAYNLKQLVGTHRDKKSTSAPLLLLHKSHNSVDRMSDLMEIDFSIKQQQQQQQQQQLQQQQKQIQKNSNSTNSRININTTITTTTTTTTITPPSTLSSSTTITQIMPTTTATASLLNKTYISKSVLPITTTTATTVVQKDMPSIAITTTTTTAASTTIAATTTTTNSKYSLSSNNLIRKYNNKTTTTTTTKQHLQPQQQQQQQHVTATDNGYLEMKPVGVGQQNIKQQQPQQQHQLKKQRSEQLHINQTPKTITSTIIATTTNKEQNEGYDVPPDIKSNKQQQQQQPPQHQHLIIRNLNANITPTTTTTTATVATTLSTNIKTVLANESQQQQQQQKQEIELKSDNDNNHNNLAIISLNDENNIKQQQQQNNKIITGIIGLSTPERKYDLILDLEQENSKDQQQKDKSQINKNLFNKNNDDYANMERKFDAYMKLNENSNNNTTTKTKTTTIAPATLASSSETMLKLYDNEKHVLTHSLSHDEKQNKQQQQQQQQQINRKSYGSAATTTTTNINNTSGYEMLQVKNNDKMLNQRIFTNLGNLKDNNNQIMPITVTTTTASAVATTTTTTTLKPRSTTTSNNGTINAISLSQPVTPTTTTTTTSTPTMNACAKITAPPPNTSRPSSLNLEPTRELLYVSLAWPSSSTSTSTSGGTSQEVKPTATVTNSAIEGNMSGETVVLPSCTSVHNVYAKIDFDHSDSSSSSSKNI